ncbi:hypothetical protein MRX96_027435 [Rhipicephalus microplus]
MQCPTRPYSTDPKYHFSYPGPGQNIPSTILIIANRHERRFNSVADVRLWSRRLLEYTAYLVGNYPSQCLSVQPAPFDVTVPSVHPQLRPNIESEPASTFNERTDASESATVVSMDQVEQVIVVAWSEKEKTMGKELTFSAVFTLNPGLQHINRKSVKKLPKHMKVPLTSAKSTTVQDWRSCARPALQKQLVHNRAKRPPTRTTSLYQD